MQAHHDATVRTTIEFPDDLHRIATSLAGHNERSLGQIVAALARSNGGRLATFDTGMAALHSEVVDLMT